MGRIVKGAQYAQQTYQVKPPSSAQRLSAASPDEDTVFASFSAAPRSDDFETPLPAADPSEELEAARAEAFKLIEEASQNAQRLVEEAQQRSLALIDEAEGRALQIEADAKRAGFEQGQGDGRQAAQAEMDDMLQTMRGLIEMARAERHKIIETAEPEIVSLAVNLAERILNAHVAVEPETVLEMARAAITRLVSREMVTVRVNPADIDTMRAHRDVLATMNDLDNLRVVEDQRVDRGGVVFETEAGTIDAKISTQLREVRRLLAVEDALSVAPSNEPTLINPPAQAS